MKLNEKVMLCQDGKLCRSNIGTVVAKTKYKVKIAFMYDGKAVTTWLRPYGNTRQQRELRRYGAWCAVDTFCPWYSAQSLKRVRRNLGESADYYISMAVGHAEGHLTKDVVYEN